VFAVWDRADVRFAVLLFMFSGDCESKGWVVLEEKGCTEKQTPWRIHDLANSLGIGISVVFRHHRCVLIPWGYQELSLRCSYHRQCRNWKKREGCQILVSFSGGSI
jgi:hypothetical protein